MIKLLRFNFKSPLHISKGTEDYSVSKDYIHSDTVYAAISQVQNLLGKNITSYEDFTITSLFPYKKLNTKYIYFFPKPFSPLKIQNKDSQQEQDPKLAKLVKKIKWIDMDFFNDWINGRDVVFGESKGNTNEPKKYLKEQFLTSYDILGDYRFVYLKEVLPRNSVPRNLNTGVGFSDKKNNTQIFYSDRLRFDENCGLWCIIEAKDTNTYKAVKSALEFLQDEGLGTDRSVGNGCFLLEEDSIPDYLFDKKLDYNSDYVLNLSLYVPHGLEEAKLILQNEIKECKRQIAYDLTKRGGWITQEPYLTLRKKSIYMFKEGSVFYMPKSLREEHHFLQNSLLSGGKPNINLTPSILNDKATILRCGKSLFLPVIINNE